MDPERDAIRRDLLLALGGGAAIDELLAYDVSPFDRARLAQVSLPLPDEPHLAAWADYAAEASRRGVLDALADVLVQFRFPIEAGISQTEAYRAATRRGIRPDGPPRLAVEDPEGLSLLLHPTPAGRIPILTARSRRDFVTLVRACSCRNEPEPVPDSMGACIVVGLNNWDRVARHRRRLQEGRPPLSEDEWNAAFKALVPRKDQYQDRFIILSCEPYSAVPAGDVGMADDAWRAASLAIRREHECTHYFTLRVFGAMRNNLLDEFVADFAGLAAAFGRYDSSLFLRFLGLEAHPRYREGGRLALYLGQPPLSASAVELVRELVVRAARRLEDLVASYDLSDAGTRASLVAAASTLTLEELASDRLPRLLGGPPIAGGLGACVTGPRPS